MAESLWEPNLAPEDLFETISQTLLNAVDRDAYSGWGATVWVIEKASLKRFGKRETHLTAIFQQDKVTKRTLKARMD
jgi:20S proteasome subunit beta 3